jgi:hypothetical protein
MTYIPPYTLTFGSGNVDASTQRVTLAADGAAVTALTAINNKLGSLGQKTMAGSAPVTLASDQVVNVSPDNVLDNATTSGTVSSAATVVSVSTAGFSGGSFHITGNAGANTITFEQSNDNSNWALLPTTDVSSSTTSPSSTTTGATPRAYATSMAYVRARVSTYVSGSVSITLTQKRVAPQIIGQALAGNSAVIGDIGIQYRANATGAATALSYISGGTTAASAIKASAGRLIGWQLSNSAASVRSVKLFNVASGSITMGTTSAVFEIDIPAGGVSNIQLPGGIAFGTAIAAAITSAKGLTDNTATGLASGDVSGAFFYA